MVRRLVELSLRFQAVVILAAVVLIGVGLWAYSSLDIEAYPDPVQPRIETIVQPPGWAAEEVERYSTIPLEVALNGMPGLDHIRSISVFGLSDIKCYFKWGTSYRDDRQEVLNRLVTVALPNALQPTLSPENAIGEIYRYTITGPGYSLAEKKTAQDWILERQFKQVDGVLDVVGFGGVVKQYRVDVDPYRLRGHGLNLPPVLASLQNANQNVGANVLNLGEQSFNVRGIGLIRGVDDIRNVVISSKNGTPVRVGDVADVTVGHAPRLGIVGQDADDDVVQGIVIMRLGGNTLQTLENVKRKIGEIRRDHLLPPGMDLHPYYDRTELIRTTTRTVLHNLVLGMILVSAVLLLFLGNWRAAAIAALNIPLALFAALSGMAAGGTPANLISLGAVDFGIIIESTVIMIESCYRHLGRDVSGNRRERIIGAAAEVGRPIVFSTIILGVAFLPLFTLTGVTGVIFSPMAHTYAYAIAGAFLLSLTLTPALARHLPMGLEERDNALLRFLHTIYVPATEWTLSRPVLAAGLGLIPVLLVFALFPFVGREFMPKLEEGNFWIRATLPLSVSLPQSSRYVRRMREILRAKPEVVTVVSQLGRPDDGTDVSGPYNIELFVPLKPFDKWPRGMDKERLTKVLSDEFARELPGIVFNFSQNIQDNVEEALSGVKGENTIKVVGPSLTIDEKKATEIVAVLKNVRGIEDLGLVQTLGQPNLTITPDRALCARYGLNVADVEAVIQAAIGGQAVTQVFEGEKRFDLVVRWQEPYRDSVRRIQEILVGTPEGGQVPLGQIASVREEEGPATVYREDNHRYVPVKFSVRGRDLKSTLDEARDKIGEAVTLPYDTYLEWAGEINELKDAERRLKVIVPLTLLLISLLAYGAVRRWPETAIVLLTIPLACSGGLLALIVTGISFSVSAAMGFISIFGIAIQDGILVTSYTQRFWNEGLSIEEGIRRGVERGFRPVLMTSLVAMLGLLPAALSNAIGAQTQKPLAVAVIGGALFVAFLTRIVRPPMLLLARRWFPVLTLLFLAAASATAQDANRAFHVFPTNGERHGPPGELSLGLETLPGWPPAADREIVLPLPLASPEVAGTTPLAGKKHFWAGVGEGELFNLFVWSYNRFVRKAQFAYVSPSTWWTNLRRGWNFDRDSFQTNNFLHPYHGNLYFNSARANGYGFWESIPFAAGGSLFWEYFLENEQVDYSDVAPTTLGGPVEGEVLFRVSRMILDNTASGTNRLLREVAAAILNPAGSLVRLERGETRKEFSNPDDRFPSRFALTVMAGYRHVPRGSSDTEHRDQGFAAAALRYGDPFDGGLSKPFDVFEASLEVVSPAEAVLTRLSERGLVALSEVGSSSASQHRLGVFMNYEYRNDGLQTFWQSGFSGSLLSRFAVPAGAEVRTEAGLTAFPLSALQTDYPVQDLAETGRTYDYGPGGGARVAVALQRRGVDLLSASYEAIWIRTTNGVSHNSGVQFGRIEARCPLSEGFTIGTSWDWDQRITSYDQNPTVRTSHIQWRIFGVLN